MKFIDLVFGHLIARCFIGGLVGLYFLIFGRIKVVGKEKLPKEGGVLYYANHPSMMDPFLILVPLFYWRSFFNPRTLPWSPVAKENYYPKNSRRVPVLKFFPFVRDLPILAWLCRHSHGLAVDRGRRDNGTVEKLGGKILRNENVLIFPEGKRSGLTMCKFQLGIYLIYKKYNPLIVPIKIENSEKVLPIGAGWPNWKKGEVVIRIEEPINNILQKENTREGCMMIFEGSLR